MSRHYKILSEKYQSILENDKEDILAGLETLDSERTALIKAREAFMKIVKGIRKLHSTKYRLQVAADWSSGLGVTFNTTKTPHGLKLQINRLIRFNIEAQEQDQAYEQDILNIIKTVAQEYNITNQLRYRLRLRMRNLAIWYDHPGAKPGKNQLIRPVT